MYRIVLLIKKQNETNNKFYIDGPSGMRRMNEQTAVNNYYQKSIRRSLPATVNAKEEFDTFVKLALLM
jgi:hypothetical protein